MSTQVIYGFKVIVIGLVVTGIIWSYFTYEFDMEQKIYFSMIGVSYIFFLLSPLIGFYRWSSRIVGFNVPYLKAFNIFFSYLFKDIFISWHSLEYQEVNMQNISY